jgi:predicted ATPase
MIAGVRIVNFKCFEDEALSLKALTLLAGGNGTGKSSVLQALLLVRQAITSDLSNGYREVALGDILGLQLGTAAEIDNQGILHWQVDVALLHH